MSTKTIGKGILLFGWCWLIFQFSHADGSSSQMVSDGFLSFLWTSAPEWLHLGIRKLAHFSEYAILAILAFSFFRDRQKKSFVLSFVFSFFYAISDEYHQLFVPGRSGQWSDVAIDSLGVLLGLFLLYLWGKRRGKCCHVKKR